MATPQINDASASLPPKKRMSLLLRISLWGALLAVLAVTAANQMKRFQKPCMNACVNNLRQIDGAKEQCALEHKLTSGDLATAEQISEYLKGRAIPTCPGGGKYILGLIGERPFCTFPGNTHKLN